MKSAALDLGQYGITVNELVPSLIATDMTMNETCLKRAYLNYATEPPAGIRPACASNTRPCACPWLSPDDMAPIVVFLGSDEAQRISGASFDVDASNNAQFTA